MCSRRKEKKTREINRCFLARPGRKSSTQYDRERPRRYRPADQFPACTHFFSFFFLKRELRPRAPPCFKSRPGFYVENHIAPRAAWCTHVATMRNKVDSRKHRGRSALDSQFRDEDDRNTARENLRNRNSSRFENPSSIPRDCCVIASERSEQVRSRSSGC